MKRSKAKDEYVTDLISTRVPRSGLIRELRKALNWKQEQLFREFKDARGISIKQPYLSQIEIHEEEGKHCHLPHHVYVELIEFLQETLKGTTNTAGTIRNLDVVCVSCDEDIRDAINIMTRRDFSQLPVIDKHGKQVGKITETDILKLFERLTSGEERRNVSELKVADVIKMQEEKDRAPFPRVPEDATIDDVANLLNKHAAILTKRDGKITGIITKANLMEHLLKKTE